MLVYFALRRFNAYIKSKGVTGFFVPEALSVVILSTFLSWACETLTRGAETSMETIEQSSKGDGAGRYESESVPRCCCSSTPLLYAVPCFWFGHAFCYLAI